MAAAGQITPMPSGAIFADTQAEPKAVYDWLDYLEKQLPFPVHRVTAGNLEAFQTTHLKSSDGTPYIRNLVPAFTSGKNGNGILNRSCTKDFKIVPVQRKMRALLKELSLKTVVQWMGFLWMKFTE